MRNILWLLEATAHGVFNSNAKWQHRSDEAFLSLGLQQVPLIPQLFSKYENGIVVFLAVKIVANILPIGTDTTMRQFITEFNKIFALGVVDYSPGVLQFYGLNMMQYEELPVVIHAEDKLNALEPYPVSRTRRCQIDETMNRIELNAYMSLNTSLGWLDVTVSSLRAVH